MRILNRLLKSVEVSTNTIKANFIVFDVETTGLDRQNDRIIEFALIEMSPNGVEKQWNTLINPQGPVRKSEIHGITDADVVDAPTFNEAAKTIVELISGKTLVAHNAVFDLAFLRSEMKRAGWTTPFLNAICTLEASTYYLPELGRRKLGDCCEAAGITIKKQHRAPGDVKATAQLINYYLDNSKYPSPRSIDIEKINQGSPSNFRFDPLNKVEVKRNQRKISQLEAKKDFSSTKQLIALVDSIKLDKYIGLELEPGFSSYLEKLLEFLEDGDINEDESRLLQELARTYELSSQKVQKIHGALITALSLHVQEDETINVNERSEIKQLCIYLGFKESDSAEFIKKAKLIKNAQLSQSAKELPKDWNLGEPLRVGDRVVFTGCDPFWREKFEKKTREAGITVSSGVTKKTKMLITDGSYVGNKANDANALGIRVVSQIEYEKLLDFRQPPIGQN